MKKIVLLLGLVMALNAANAEIADENSENLSKNGEKIMLTKISKIKVKCEFVNQYKALASEISLESTQNERGVLVLYPLQDAENPCEFSIIEAYKDAQSYQRHIKSAHFAKYKKESLKMVEKLEFVPFESLNKKMFLSIGEKK